MRSDHSPVGIEDLTSHPDIWRGFAIGNGGCAADAALPTGFDELDRYLPGGGWPLRAITEIFLERYGIGELSLLMPALARLSRSAVERWIVWIAPPFVPYAPALVRCGIDLNRVLLVHPTGGKREASRRDVSKREALWAIEQAIRSKASVAVLAWLAAADHAALRRLQLAAEENQCWTVLFRPAPAMRQGSPAALRMKLSPDAGRARVDVVKCRGRRPQTIALLGGSGRVGCS